MLSGRQSNGTSFSSRSAAAHATAAIARRCAGEPAPQLADGKRGEDGEAQHHHDAHALGRPQKREDGNRGVEDRIQARHADRATPRTSGLRSNRRQQRRLTVARKRACVSGADTRWRSAIAGAGETQPDRDETRKEHRAVPVADDGQHPRVCVRAGREIRPHVRRPLPRIVERARKAGVFLNRRDKAGRTAARFRPRRRPRWRSRSRTGETSTAAATRRRRAWHIRRSVRPRRRSTRTTSPGRPARGPARRRAPATARRPGGGTRAG